MNLFLNPKYSASFFLKIPRQPFSFLNHIVIKMFIRIQAKSRITHGQFALKPLVMHIADHLPQTKSLWWFVPSISAVSSAAHGQYSSLLVPATFYHLTGSLSYEIL